MSEHQPVDLLPETKEVYEESKKLAKWHCLVDSSKYCNGTPEWEEEPQMSGVGFFGHGTCKLSPETCERCQSLEEQIDLTVPWLSKPTFVENVIPIEKPKKDGEKKPMSKKAKKLEAELAQGSMF